MKHTIILFLISSLSFSYVSSQENKVDPSKIKDDLNEIISDLALNYIYLEEKNVDLACIKKYYENQIQHIKTKDQTVLLFEYLLDEFYDSHLILNTNVNESFRLFSPVYALFKNEKPIVSSIWQSQIENLDQNLIGAELLKINGIDFSKAIEQFPTQCNNKNSLAVREWILNKILAGRYNKPRIFTLKLHNNKIIQFDLDKLKIKSNTELLTSTIKDDIGIIRIHNSLGNNNLINEFDKALHNLIHTKGLIIDLRNTVDGGNSYVARGIMGRFIDQSKPYQKHWTIEQYDRGTKIERSWVEYVSPRKETYKKPIIILVGRWTGSMGEGIAIGFEGMERATIMGTEMERLAGEVNNFSFQNQKFGYQLSTAKLFHIDGTPREQYIPKHYIQQSTIKKDETLQKGIELIKGIIK